MPASVGGPADVIGAEVPVVAVERRSRDTCSRLARLVAIADSGVRAARAIRDRDRGASQIHASVGGASIAIVAVGVSGARGALGDRWHDTDTKDQQ